MVNGKLHELRAFEEDVAIQMKKAVPAGAPSDQVGIVGYTGSP